MAYCSVSDIRVITNLTTTDISDEHITALIEYATSQLNHMINSRIIEERVECIDSTRENKIDGLNTEFYVQNSFKWYLGDLNDDGQVDSDDVEVFKYASDGTKTRLTVSAVDASLGKITLDSAPEQGSTLTITYSYAPLDESTPHPLIKQACMLLASALCYTKIEAGKLKQFKLGKLTVARQPEAFNTYFSQAMRTIKLIQSRMLRRTDDVPLSLSKLEERRFP